MISFIIQEHKESEEFIRAMLKQIRKIPQDKEVLLVTSTRYPDYIRRHRDLFLAFDDLDIQVYGNIHSCGRARNVGAKNALGSDLIFTDCHVCFTPEAIERVLDTLHQSPTSVVAPEIQVVDFPGCGPTGGIGHGVAFRFVHHPFEWVWLPHETLEKPFRVPFVCGCFFLMTKQTYNALAPYGGFLGWHQGLGWEEEATMRLARLGHDTLVEPRAVVGHYFKKGWPPESTRGYVDSRALGFYLNVFDPSLWNHIYQMCSREWSQWEFESKLKRARDEFSWIREKLRPLKDRIDERYFLRMK